MISEAVKIAIIAATPPSVVAMGGVVLGWINRGKINEVHLSINSRLDQLVKAAHAEGRQQERDSHSVTVPGVPQTPLP
jgi:hypothetical protein